MLRTIGVAALALNTSAWGALPASEVARYADEATFVICRADVAQLDMDAFWKCIEPVLAEIPAEQRAAIEMTTNSLVRRWLYDFQKAGGREIIAVISAADRPDDEMPRLMVPLEDGADVRALSGLLCSADPAGATERNTGGCGPYPYAAQAGDVVLLGTAAQHERVTNLVPPLRPRVNAALDAVDGSMLYAVAVPPEYAKRVIAEYVPVLYEPFDNVPISVVLDGLEWAAVSIERPPDLGLSVIIQSRDAKAAEAFKRLLDQAKRILAAWGEVHDEVPAPDRLFRRLNFVVEGDRILLHLDREALIATALEQVIPMVHMARVQSERVVSMSRLKQIGMAIHMYAADHKDVAPETLQALVEAQLMQANDLMPPDSDESGKRYVYACPGVSLKHMDPQTILVHESFDAWPDEGVAVLFADGHVEGVRDEARFREHLARCKVDQQKANP